MLEYLNFCLICVIFRSIFYLYIRIKKYFQMLKMAEEFVGNLGYGAPQSDTKCQKLLESRRAEECPKSRQINCANISMTECFHKFKTT